MNRMLLIHFDRGIAMARACRSCGREIREGVCTGCGQPEDQCDCQWVDEEEDER